MVSPLDLPTLSVAIGRRSSASPSLPVRVLAGEPVERFFSLEPVSSPSPAVRLFGDRAWRVGFASRPVAGDLSAVSAEIYADVLKACAGHQLARIWNYVPQINELGRDGLENYGAFCLGRSLAFERFFGSEYRSRAPSASAVGGDGTELVVMFAAYQGTPRHYENPQQVPAYEYPPQYGPRPPTFARATFVEDQGASICFIAGTSSIRGHQTVAPHDTHAQLECTIENLRAMGRRCGIGPDLAAGRSAERHFKVYLRHSEDQSRIAAVLSSKLLAPRDVITYLHADICRKELNIEIEATIRVAPPRPERVARG